MVAISMLLWTASKAALGPLVLIPNDVLHGQVWRIVTWPLVNRPDIFAVLGLFFFWTFGRALEEEIGRRNFLWFLVILTVVPGVVATLVGWPLAEFRYIEMGVFVAFAAEHRNARFLFNIPAWAIAAVIIGIEVLQLLADRLIEGIIVLVALVFTSLVLLKSFGMGRELPPWIPALKLPSGGKGKTKGKGGKVVAGPWSPPRPGASSVDQAELDRLLDKVSSGGMGSLTSAEQMALKELSKRLRDGR